MVRRETSDRLDRIESTLAGLRSDLDALRSGLEPRFAPFSEIERLNLAFDLLSGKAPASEVDRLNEAFDGLSEKAPLSEVARLDRAFEHMGVLTEGLNALREETAELRSAWDARFAWRSRFEPQAFVEAFRGTADALYAAYQDLADEATRHQPVIDIGCGRGEFLDLLVARGADAGGVEIDVALAAEARSRGLDVATADAVEYLRTLRDHSIGCFVLIQVVEHLTHQGLLDALSLTADKLRMGGRLIVETVNPTSLYVFANAFYVDPTHSTPVHPGYLMFVLRELGFSDAEIRWRSPVSDGDRLQRVDAGPEELVAALNANIDRLNEIVFGPQDYAIIATR